MAQLKPLPKFVLILAAVAGVAYGVKFASDKGYLGSAQVVSSTVVDTKDVPTQGSAAAIAGSTAAMNFDLPKSQFGGTVRVLTIPWNATTALHYANGDDVTTPDSLIGRRGVKVKLERQDDYAQMMAEQLAFAKDENSGAAFVVIMGDGLPAYAAAANDTLGKVGHSIEVVGALGYSRGEDKCMLPVEVKADAQKARGSLVGGVLRDGDWNICVKWAGDNGIPVNPDEKTYDPDAMNFIATSSFTESDEKLIAGYCEERPLVKAGKPTGESRRVCQNGSATWTPGDVKIAREKGGVVPVASTKEYIWQMPAVLIGNKKWNAAHPDVVKAILASTFEGSDAVKRSDSELLKGSTVVAKVAKEEDGAWWAKYFKGAVETDKLGHSVALGGSTTNNLADNQYLFGLNGNDNIYKRVYTVFGNIAKNLYPQVMPTVLPYETVVNTTYIEQLAQNARSAGTADKPTFTATAPVTESVANRSWSIEFDTGKNSFKSQAVPVLEELLNQVSVSGLTIVISGHTDNVGNSATNMTLSRQRAIAVKTWLETNAGSTFPEGRIRVRGYGDSQPVADNGSADGRAKNRRVEIALVKTN